RPEERQRTRIEVLDHSQLLQRSQSVDSVKALLVVVEEDNAREQLAGRRQQPEPRLQYDPESALGAREQIDPLHGWPELVARCVFARWRKRHLGYSEGHLRAALVFGDGPAHVGDREAQNMAPRATVPKTPRPAGVRRDAPADARGLFCGIGSIELMGACR